MSSNTLTIAELRVLNKSKPKRNGSGKTRDNTLGLLEHVLASEKIPFEREYKFHPKRKWRFDLAIPDHKIAVEYEGINSKKSRHTSVTGYTKDTEKYNAAVLLGWRVLRYSALNMGQAYSDVLKAINANHL